MHLDVKPETTATGGVVEAAPALEAVYLPDYERVPVVVRATLARPVRHRRADSQ